MKNSKKIGLVVGGIVVLAATFYAGMTYGGNNVRAAIGNRSMFFGQNIGGMRGLRNMGGFTGGEIIAKDDKSITVKLPDSGSKIIFFDANTKVSKSVAGATTDLTVGTQVSVTGTPNADGSVNATTVQIRPNMTAPVVK